MPNDLEIARAATFEPIMDVAARAGIPPEALHLHGAHVAKVDPKLLPHPAADKKAKLILVTAINPTPAGEGKTTTTIGLGDALRQLGKNTIIALREPSLGPCFGTKGGATGGGYAQIIPMERINLHFTGDFHAIGAAHNLLSAMIDNHLYWGLDPKLDARKIDWRRVVDMNDRFLRQYAGGLGGSANGFARETGFDITAASEIMAIFCLARDIADLEARLSRIVIGTGADKKPVTAKDIEAVGAMLVLLKDALMPNLVQTLEGTPAFVHGGPFANIAHGCNSVIATRTALDLADYVVTESGFGADLGAEKFFDIKCRSAGLTPSVAVIVATARALKSHGGIKLADLGKEDLGALKKGLANLGRHVENVKKFGLPVVVAINHFLSDTDAELAVIETVCKSEFGAEAILCKHWSLGGKGAIALAERVLTLSETGEGQFHSLYEDALPLAEKIRKIVKEIYRGADIALDSKVKKQLAEFEAMGFGNLPVCIAKTQYSFATDAAALGAPIDHIVPVREVRLSAGAGFVVAVCGDIMTMPGLSKRPAAKDMGLDQDGNIFGLF